MVPLIWYETGAFDVEGGGAALAGDEAGAFVTVFAGGAGFDAGCEEPGPEGGGSATGADEGDDAGVEAGAEGCPGRAE